MLNISTEGSYIPVYAFKNRSNDKVNMAIQLKNNQAPKPAYFRVAFPNKVIFESGTRVCINKAFISYFINSNSGYPSYFLQVIEYDVQDESTQPSEPTSKKNNLKDELPFL